MGRTRVGRTSKRGFGCMVRELIAWIVPGSPTAPDYLPQTLCSLCRTKLTTSFRRSPRPKLKHAVRPSLT